VIDPRTEELAANLAAVRRRVDAACAAAGRRTDSVTIVAVTKTWPAADVRRLAGLGIVDVAENRDQEASPKARSCQDLGLTWHFVGQLQTNKTASVAGYADVVHAVDRQRLVTALDKAAGRVGRQLRVLVQVSLDAQPFAGSGGRGGIAPRDLEGLAGAIAEADHLELGGIMAVAPRDVDPETAFAPLMALSATVQSLAAGADWVSAGMSGDFEAAIACGATHVRLGSVMLGKRPPLR
jgi:pyridoxal phosphate enzyme (YggS family)